MHTSKGYKNFVQQNAMQFSGITLICPYSRMGISNRLGTKPMVQNCEMVQLKHE